MDPRSLIDDALEITVVGSFSSLGHRLRRRLFRWHDDPPGSLDGRTILVTGPTSGLGRATVLALAGLGARVILAGRGAARLKEIRDLVVAATGHDRHASHVVDMSSLASVQALVDAVVAEEARLDGIIDNAGAIHRERATSSDGIEKTFATMVVGPFRLLSGLLPMLREAPDARVISVVSGGMYGQALDLDDLQSEDGRYDGVRAYARAKRAQTTIVREWARRLGNGGPSVDAMHPGWADTPGLTASLPEFHRLIRPILRSPAEGIDTIVWLTTRPRPASAGALYLDRQRRPFDRLPQTRIDAAGRARLFALVAELAGVSEPLGVAGD